MRPNSILFTRLNYKNDSEMYEDIFKQLQLLVNAGYVCIVHDASGNGSMIMIDYSVNDPDRADVYPYWLSPIEAHYLEENELSFELEEHKNALEKAGYNVSKKKKHEGDFNA